MTRHFEMSVLVLSAAAIGCGSNARPSGESNSMPPPLPDASTNVSGGGGVGTAPSASTVATAKAGAAAFPPMVSAAGDAAAGGGNAGTAGTAPAVDEDAGATPAPDDAGTAVASCPTKAYVSNSGSDDVSVIDTSSGKVLATVPTDKAPVNPTFTPDRRQVYVANSQASTLTIIDVETNETKTIQAGGGDRPSGLAFSPNGETLYVSLISQDYTSPGSVLSIDLKTGMPSAPLMMGADPERIAVTPSGDRLYVDNLLDGTMAIIDTATFKVLTTVMLGDLPFNPLMSPDGSVVYVGVMSANHIAVVDTKTNQVARTIPADSPNGMTFSADFQSLIVSNALNGTVQEVSLTSDMIVKTQMVGGLPGNIALLPDGAHAYMVRPDGNTVEVLDVSSLMIIDTITVGTGPSVVTIARCSGPRA